MEGIQSRYQVLDCRTHLGVDRFEYIETPVRGIWQHALRDFECNYKENEVTVFGVNRSGVAAAKLLWTSGATVTVTDTRDAAALSREIADLDDAHKSEQTGRPYRKFLGGHPPECIAEADFIVVSPGVPLQIPILCDARAQ